MLIFSLLVMPLRSPLSFSLFFFFFFSCCILGEIATGMTRNQGPLLRHGQMLLSNEKQRAR